MVRLMYICFKWKTTNYFDELLNFCDQVLESNEVEKSLSATTYTF
jgi:hypothetical protein